MLHFIKERKKRLLLPKYAIKFKVKTPYQNNIVSTGFKEKNDDNAR